MQTKARNGLISGVTAAVIVGGIAAAVVMLSKSENRKIASCFDGGGAWVENECALVPASAPRVVATPTSTSITVFGIGMVSYAVYRAGKLVVEKKDERFPIRITGLAASTTYVVQLRRGLIVFVPLIVTTTATPGVWPPIHFSACGLIATTRECDGSVAATIEWDPMSIVNVEVVDSNVQRASGTETAEITQPLTMWFPQGTTQTITLTRSDGIKTMRTFLVPVLSQLCGPGNVLSTGCGTSTTTMLPVITSVVAVPCSSTLCAGSSVDIVVSWTMQGNTIFLERDANAVTTRLLTNANANTFTDTNRPIGTTYTYYISTTGVAGTWISRSITISPSMSGLCFDIGASVQDERCVTVENYAPPVVSATVRHCIDGGVCTLGQTAEVVLETSNPLAGVVTGTVTYTFEENGINIGTVTGTDTGVTFYVTRNPGWYLYRVKAASGGYSTGWKEVTVQVNSLETLDASCTDHTWELFDTNTGKCTEIVSPPDPSYITGPCVGDNCTGSDNNYQSVVPECSPVLIGNTPLDAQRFSFKYPGDWTFVLNCPVPPEEGIPCFLTGENHKCCNYRGTLVDGSCTCNPNVNVVDATTCKPCSNCNVTGPGPDGVACFDGFSGDTCQSCAPNYSPALTLMQHNDSVFTRAPWVDTTCRLCGTGFAVYGTGGNVTCSTCGAGWEGHNNLCVSTCINALFGGTWKFLDGKALSTGVDMEFSTVPALTRTDETLPNVCSATFAVDTNTTIFKWRFLVGTKELIMAHSVTWMTSESRENHVVVITYRNNTTVSGARKTFSLVNTSATCLPTDFLTCTLKSIRPSVIGPGVIGQFNVLSNEVGFNTDKTLMRIDEAYVISTKDTGVHLLSMYDGGLDYGTTTRTTTVTNNDFFHLQLISTPPSDACTTLGNYTCNNSGTWSSSTTGSPMPLCWACVDGTCSSVTSGGEYISSDSCKYDAHRACGWKYGCFPSFVQREGVCVGLYPHQINTGETVYDSFDACKN